jgi:hypothetical protein
VSLFHRQPNIRWPETKQEAESYARGSWWEFHSAATAFGLPPHYTRNDVELAFRRLAPKVHPDTGGTREAFQALIVQRDLLLSQARDLL